MGSCAWSHIRLSRVASLFLLAQFISLRGRRRSIILLLPRIEVRRFDRPRPKSLHLLDILLMHNSTAHRIRKLLLLMLGEKTSLLVHRITERMRTLRHAYLSTELSSILAVCMGFSHFYRFLYFGTFTSHSVGIPMRVASFSLGTAFILIFVVFVLGSYHTGVHLLAWVEVLLVLRGHRLLLLWSGLRVLRLLAIGGHRLGSHPGVHDHRLLLLLLDLYFRVVYDKIVDVIVVDYVRDWLLCFNILRLGNFSIILEIRCLLNRILTIKVNLGKLRIIHRLFWLKRTPELLHLLM